MLKKIISTLSLSIVLAISTHTVTSAQENDKYSKDSIYVQNYNIELEDLDTVIEGDNVKIDFKKKNDNITEKAKNNKEYLESRFKKDKKFKEDFKNSVKNGKTPNQIGVAEYYILRTLDKSGKEIDSRPMTESEVQSTTFSSDISTAIAKDNSSNEIIGKVQRKLANGQTQTKDTLALYTSISGTSPTYWVQSNASWGTPNSATGDDVIGVLWENNFRANNTSTSTINYDHRTTVASLSKFDATKGAAWSFPSSHYMSAGLYDRIRSAYAGISITRSGALAQRTFVSEYIHTWQSYSVTPAFTIDSTKATSVTITLSGVTKSWKLPAYITGRY